MRDTAGYARREAGSGAGRGWRRSVGEADCRVRSSLDRVCAAVILGRVGQTSGATQRGLNLGCSERIGNSRRTGVDEGATVTLRGSGVDPDAGDTLQYSWTQTGGDGVALSAASEASTTFAAPTGLTEDAVLTFSLRVTDAGGLVGEDATTVTVASDGAQRPPLTASFQNLPWSHDGNPFTFRLSFSEAPDVSYQVLRDEAFDVTGGAVRRARRVDGRDDLREIHVEPDSQVAVTIRLPETTNCDAYGAICTGDGRPLSHSLSATVAGPHGGERDADVQTDESSKTINVSLIDDAHDEGVRRR